MRAPGSRDQRAAVLNAALDGPGKFPDASPLQECWLVLPHVVSRQRTADEQQERADYEMSHGVALPRSLTA